LPGYADLRQKFADELLRVTRPGGRLLISCPNKSFPIDHEHEVKDCNSPDTASVRIRESIYQKTGMNVHRTWGQYNLLSYSEVRSLFCEVGSGVSFEPLPLRGYFSLERVRSSRLKLLAGVANMYINKMPVFIRPTFLNPYMLVEIRK
jgi:SAM-dependent methyltransferase